MGHEGKRKIYGPLREPVYGHRLQNHLRATGQKELLITLLNELLAGEHHIEDLTFIDKEDNSDNVNDRGIIFDLYCLTSSGEYIIVEMQNRWHSNFLDRTLYYVCRAISRLIERPVADEVDLPASGNDGVTGVKEAQPRYGDRYKLSTVYGIFLMNLRKQNWSRNSARTQW